MIAVVQPEALGRAQVSLGWLLIVAAVAAHLAKLLADAEGVQDE